MENRNTNHNIQALRAIAILLVIIQHLHRLPIPEWLMITYSSASYWSGVDIFLAISGFLMCKSLETEISHHGHTVCAFFSFFKKRIFRLTPALVAWAAICVLIAYTLQPYNGISLEKSFDTLIYSLLEISNFFYFQKTISGISYDPLLSVTWSLSLEWQLYFLLSALAISLTTKNLYISLIAIIIASSTLLPNNINHQETIGWWIRPQAFIFGSLIYLSKNRISKLKINKYLSILMCATCLFLLVFFTSIIPPQFKLFYIGILGSTIFILLALKTPPFHSKVLEWIGDRSYSIYLCHIPAMIITRFTLDYVFENRLLLNSSVVYILFFCLITGFCSNLSYRYIEQPFINLYRKKQK